MSGELPTFQRPPLPARKGSQSSDALMEARKKKKEKKEKKDKKEQKEKKPHRFTKRPRGYVRGKFKNLLTTSDASFQLDGSFSSSSSSSSSDDEKHHEPKSPHVAEKPFDSEKDGPIPSPRSPRGEKPDLKSATTTNEPEAPRPKRTNRRRFSTEGRLQGTFLVTEEKVETRHQRSGSVSKRPTSLDHISNDNNDHRNNHVAFTLRHFKDPARKEEKRKRKQLKKLETDQASHPIAWAVGRVLFPFEITFQVSASKAYPPAYHWLTRIDDVLLVGGIIFKKEVKNLVKYQNVGGVINMCEEWKGPVKEYKKYGVENCYMPTCDPVHVALSSLIKGVEFIEKIAAQGRCVVVHCKAGRGRSSSVAICYYIKHKGMTAKEANEFLWQKREFTHKNLWKRVGIQEFEKEFRGKGMKDYSEDRKDEQKSETTTDKGKEKEEGEGEGGERPTSSRPVKWRLSEKGSTLKKGTEIGRQKEYATKSKDSSDSDKDGTASSKSDKDKDSNSEGGEFRRSTKSKKKDKKAKHDNEDLLPKAKSARVGHVKKPLKTKGHRRMSSTQGRIEQTESRDRLGTGPLQLKRYASEAADTQGESSESQKERKKKMKEKRKAAKALNSPTSTETESDKKEKKEKLKDKEDVVKEEEEIDEGWIIDDKRHSDKELDKKDKKEKKEKLKLKTSGNKGKTSSSSNTSSGEIEELKEQLAVEEEAGSLLPKKKKKHAKKSSDESDNNNNNNSKIPKTFSRVKRPTATQRELLGSQREECIPAAALNGHAHENGGGGGSEIVKPNSPRGETARASSTPVSPRGQNSSEGRKLAKWLPAGKPLSSSSS